MATDTAKSGIWTEHVDANGRKFYFNMVHGRSYWELPDELLVQVKRPAIDELRDWDPSFRHELDSEEARRRREEVLLYAAANGGNGGANARATNVAPGMAALQERMAQAAQRKKKEAELKQQRATEEKQKSDDATNEYLEMVRQLQHTDKDTDTTGGKWLVR